MAFNLGSTFVTIGAVTKPLDNALNDIKSRLAKFAAKGNEISIGSVVKGIGEGIGIKAFDLALNAIEGLVTAIPKASMAAANLEAIIHKNKYTFQGMYPFIEKTIDSLTKFGHTKTELGAVASKFGDMFVGMGLNEQMTGKLTQQFMQLGVNAAAFAGIDLDDYMQTLERGIEGSTKALKRLHVFINDDQVAFARMAMGIPDTEIGNKFAKMMMAMQQLKRFTGQADWAHRQLGGTLNETAVRAKALVVSFGEMVKPAYQAGVMLINAAFRNLAVWLEQNKNSITSWAGWFRDKINDVRFTIENAGLYFDKFKVRVAGAFTQAGIWIDYIKKVMKGFADWIASNWLDIALTGIQNFETAIKNLGTNIEIFANWFKNNFKDIFKTTESWGAQWAHNMGEYFRYIKSKFTGEEYHTKDIKPMWEGGKMPPMPEFKPLMQGAKPLDQPFKPLALPLEDLKKAGDLTNEQLKKIEDVLKKQREAFDKANKLAPDKIPPLERPGMMPALAATGGFVGVADFAKRIQEGALGKDAYAMAIANNTQKMAQMMAMWGPALIQNLINAGLAGP